VRGTNLLCGTTGNCQTWVFRSVNGRWASLFEEGPLAESASWSPRSHARSKTSPSLPMWARRAGSVLPTSTTGRSTRRN